MTEQDQLEQAFTAIEAQRAILGDDIVDTMIAAMRQELAPERNQVRPTLQGERKLVTIMFADISGFSALASTMDPEAVRDLVNACFERMVPAIQTYGGTVDKFIGDEIMALFGAPVVHENDPERALRASLDMMASLADFNTERGVDLGLHIGINTGLVIAGGIGTRELQKYSVLGAAVNLASRLADVAERDEILVGPDSYRLTAPLFEFERLAPIQVKGKSEPVEAHRLLAPRVVPGKLRGLAGLASPLIGRRAEVQALTKALERLGNNQEGGIVTVVGEAGLGKSRLVAEVREARCKRQENLRWIEGRCLSYATSIAYLPWLDVLRGLLGMRKDLPAEAMAPPAAALETLRKGVQTLCPKEADTVYPYLGRLLALPLEPETATIVQDMEGEQLKAGTFHAVEALIEGSARQQPLVIVCEDLHWADPTSIELLENLFALTKRVPLLLICVFRPERGQSCWRIRERATTIYQHCHTDLWLTPLSASEGTALLSNLLHVETLPSGLRERILNHAEGNPFYVEEIIRSLMDSEAIVYDQASGHWQATRDVAEIAIPDTLHGVLMARIDRLREEPKRILQLAAVIGRIFFYRVLEAIARQEHEIDETTLRGSPLWDHLLSLQREDMIRERNRIPELEYIFKHQLTQEAAYNGLLKKERIAFHREVAQTLEQLYPDRIEEQVGLLAHHWERAAETDKAITYLLRAGDQARLAYAHQEAIDLYQRALALLKKQPQHERTARTLMKLGLTCHAAFDFQQARQAYEEGFALWQRAGEEQSTTLPPAPHALKMSRTYPLSLDPTLAGDNASTSIISQLFSGLAEQTPEMEVVPDVARTWEVSEGGRRYVFHLRDDVYWSDGTLLTAGDFCYAWKRVLDPATNSPIAGILYDVKGGRAFHSGEGRSEDVGVWAHDEFTLVVELEEPTAYFPYLLTISATYPVPRHIVEAHGKAWTKPEHIVTNGPFRLEDWQPEHSGTLLRNPDYYGRYRGNLERVELVFGQEAADILEMYENDELDILWSLWSLPMALWNRLLQRHAEEYVSLPELATHHIRFNLYKPPFDDPRVRRAFVMATDRETLADIVTKGYVFPATGGFVPPGIPGHSPGIALPYNPEQARQLLAEAGYPDGQGFPVLEALAPSGRDAWCTYLQAQWRENLGIESLWETMDWGAFIARVNSTPPHLIINGWVADYPDPDNFLRVWLQQHDHIGWENPTYNKLVEKARGITDQRQRMHLYEQADRILIEEAPIMPLIYRRWHMMVKPWVKKIPTWVIQWKDIILQYTP